jgi:putative toxin-antitoxin system antitoxin component (TIGR02293 family)
MAQAQELAMLIGNPGAEIKAVRAGITPRQVEIFLEDNDFGLKDILKCLDISPSSFFHKKKTRAKLNSEMTEKFIRFAHVMKQAVKVLESRTEATAWLRRGVPALDGQRPIDLLDTEPGHKLVEQTLLQIEYGIYG